MSKRTIVLLGLGVLIIAFPILIYVLDVYLTNVLNLSKDNFGIDLVSGISVIVGLIFIGILIGETLDNRL